MTEEEGIKMNALCIRIQEEKNYDKFAASLQELKQLIARKEGRLGRRTDVSDSRHARPWRTVPAVVKKVLPPVYPEQLEKVEIRISTADELYREIRLENRLSDVDGRPVAMQTGASVDVTIEVNSNDTKALNGGSG